MVGTAHVVRGALVGDELRQRFGLQVAPGHEQVGAGHPRGVRRAPRVGVEHRHDRQEAVVPRVRHARAGLDGNGVHERGAVRVDDTLRVAGGAARVTHRRGCPFVDLGEVERGRIGAGEDVLVAHELGGVARRLLEHRRRRRRRRPRSARRSRARRRRARAAARGRRRRGPRGRRRGSRCTRAARGTAGC